MSFTLDNLYRLLPAFDRIRDISVGNSLVPGEEHDGPLKALLQLVAEQVAVLEGNLDQLYDDQFIETCAEWVVPYIGQLVGTRGLTIFPDAAFSQRGEVANTLSYRRRKGTASIIEQLARDVTGWNASVIEYFQLLATTQYLNHLRPENLSVSGIRNPEMMESVNASFDQLPRTVEVRNIHSQHGKYNIQNIGIFLWRLNSYSLDHSPAYRLDDRRFTFDALGKDVQLYNSPEPESTITHLSTPVNVPGPFSRLIVKNYFRDYYGAGKSLLIFKNGVPVVPMPGSISSGDVEDENDPIIICNLSDEKDMLGNVTGWSHMPQYKIALDPVLGRIAFPELKPFPVNVHVNYHYGFSANMGGGAYIKPAGITAEITDVPWVKVPGDFNSLRKAIHSLESTGGVLEIMNNEYYLEALEIHMSAGKKLEIRAANKTRPVLVLDGDMDIFGRENSQVQLVGLLICGGRLRIPVKTIADEMNELQAFYLQDCTLLPGRSPAFKTVASHPAQACLLAMMPNVLIYIDKSIVGTLRVNEEANVTITNSILDATGESKIAYAGMNDMKPGGTLHIENSTIIGRVKTALIEFASNSIFLASGTATDNIPVWAERLQEGCVRFCYVPPGSIVPRQYHCQPTSDLINTASARPVFTSLEYGQAGYCQLSRICTLTIRQGADNEAEMGAFNQLYQPQREQNLSTRLNEYLRFGLDAGIFYAS